MVTNHHLSEFDQGEMNRQRGASMRSNLELPDSNLHPLYLLTRRFPPVAL
jgi:hypothetical protein